MDKEELREYLRGALRIEVRTEYRNYECDARNIYIKILLDGDVIAEDFTCL